MKNQLSTRATVYEKENSCLEDVLAIADEMERKTQPTQKLTQALLRPSSSSAGTGHTTKTGIR